MSRAQPARFARTTWYVRAAAFFPNLRNYSPEVFRHPPWSIIDRKERTGTAVRPARVSAGGVSPSGESVPRR